MKQLLVLVIVLAAEVSLFAQTASPPPPENLPGGIDAAQSFFRVRGFAPAPDDPPGGQAMATAAHKKALRRAFVESPHPPLTFSRRETTTSEEEEAAISQHPVGAEGLKATTSPDAGATEANAGATDAEPPQSTGFRWKPAVRQSLLLLAIQHGYAMTQPKTRRELRGPFLKDYFDSLRNLGGWEDGGRFFTNYIAHPLQGAATGFIQIQNDPKGVRQQFGGSKKYWTSRLKAMGWAAAMSTQFELGPISQASIGNVGKARKLTYVDLVVTPTVGAALIVGEDALDRFVVRWVEGRTRNLYLRIATRMLLNPSRSCANLFRFKKPWHRDTVR